MAPTARASGLRGSAPAFSRSSTERKSYRGAQALRLPCGEPVPTAHTIQPIGIYSIPEISFVGQTEDQLTEECVPFEVGVSRYRELARGNSCPARSMTDAAIAAE